MKAATMLFPALAVLLGACATVEEQKPPAPAPAPQAQAPVAQPAQRAAPAAAPVAAAKPAAPVLRSIHFDFDKSEIRPEFRPVLEDNAKWLRANPALKVRIEGNCDERGSREYNVGLGQRRAEEVARTLRVLGVDGRQIEPVSYGEEKPRCTAHDESCWAQNRRGDIVY
jgi:peptidoglycan-associated lipoprotein